MEMGNVSKRQQPDQIKKTTAEGHQQVFNIYIYVMKFQLFVQKLSGKKWSHPAHLCIAFFSVQSLIY